MVHIKDPLLLIKKSCSFSGSSRFPFLLYEWFFTINKTFPSFKLKLLDGSGKLDPSETHPITNLLDITD